MTLLGFMSVRRILTIGLLFYYLTEVNADQTRTALIASGCVAGCLLVAAVVIGAIYCFIRHKRLAEKKPLPRYNEESPMTNGVYKPERTFQRTHTTSGQAPDFMKESRNLAPKAYTQNAASPRQRPPVPFFTIRSDPRQAPELPGVVHMGASVYSRPPQIGRPVIFLDRNGASQLRANGGVLIRGGNGNEDHTYHSNRNSRRDKKERSRSQSRSRSREPRMLTRRHSDTLDASILGVSGEIILQKKLKDFQSYNPSKQSRRDDNNNPFALYFTSNATDQQSRIMGNHSLKCNVNEFARNSNRYIAEEGRYSIIPLNVPNRTAKTVQNHQPYFQHTEGTNRFESDDSDNSFTPRRDYSTDSPITSDQFLISRSDGAERRSFINTFPIKFDDPEDIPIADYMPDVATSNQKENLIIKSGDLDDIIAASSHQNTFYSRENDDRRDSKIAGRRQIDIYSLPLSLTSTARPLTPPFDGVDSEIPQFTFQRHEETTSSSRKLSRIPTPPPDMSPDTEVNPFSSLVFPPPPPPPPPLPPPPPPSQFVANIKHRPATPPPPGNSKHGQSLDFRDTLSTFKQHSSSSETISQKSVSDNTREGGLPFMEELKRRQRSIDEGVVLIPPLPASSLPTPQDTSPHTDQHQSSTADSFSNSSQGFNSHISDSPKHGLPARASVVQFADDPPQIIPPDNDYSFRGHDVSDISSDLGLDAFLPHSQTPSTSSTIR